MKRQPFMAIRRMGGIETTRVRQEGNRCRLARNARMGSAKAAASVSGA
jgi:hypothetical protein